MNYQDGSAVQFGDIVTIGTCDHKLITVQDDGETLILHDFVAPEKHALLVCGKSKTKDKIGPQEFYLTFKYNRGFLQYDFHNGIFKSGVPWTQKTDFDLDMLKTAIDSSSGEELIITKLADAE